MGQSVVNWFSIIMGVIIFWGIWFLRVVSGFKCSDFVEVFKVGIYLVGVCIEVSDGIVFEMFRLL